MQTTCLERSELGDVGSLFPEELVLVSRQIAALALEERNRLRALLQRMAVLDEELADLHLCLPAVQVAFYLPGDMPLRVIGFTPDEFLDLLARVPSIANTRQTNHTPRHEQYSS